MMGPVSATETILTSAAVSGVVSIIFEWIAKPRMDARKDRIVRIIENRRMFEDNLLRLDVASAMLKQLTYPPKADRRAKDALDAERRRFLEQVDVATQSMIDQLGFFALTYASTTVPGLGLSIPEMVAKYVVTVRGVHLSDRSYTRKAEIIQELTVPLRIYLFGSKWHPVRRARAMFQVPDLLGKHSSGKGTGTGEEAIG
jgi:hypothetical protein